MGFGPNCIEPFIQPCLPPCITLCQALPQPRSLVYLDWKFTAGQELPSNSLLSWLNARQIFSEAEKSWPQAVSFECFVFAFLTGIQPRFFGVGLQRWLHRCFTPPKASPESAWVTFQISAKCAAKSANFVKNKEGNTRRRLLLFSFFVKFIFWVFFCVVFVFSWCFFFWSS